jgi:hypothetical protein
MARLRLDLDVAHCEISPDRGDDVGDHDDRDDRDQHNSCGVPLDGNAGMQARHPQAVDDARRVALLGTASLEAVAAAQWDATTEDESDAAADPRDDDPPRARIVLPAVRSLQPQLNRAASALMHAHSVGGASTVGDGSSTGDDHHAAAVYQQPLMAATPAPVDSPRSTYSTPDADRIAVLRAQIKEQIRLELEGSRSPTNI